MSHLPLDARAILHYLNELGYRNISAEQLKEFLKGMQPQSEIIKKSKFKTQQQRQTQQLPTTPTTRNLSTAATTTAAGASAAGATVSVSPIAHESHKRGPTVKVIKCKKPLCHFKFYLDIRDHQLTKRIEDQIKLLGGSLEFFLTPSVTHFVTDKPVAAAVVNYNNNTSCPGTPQTPQTPLTPQTQYSLENFDGSKANNGTVTVPSKKPIRNSRADAILNRARRLSTATTTPTTGCNTRGSTTDQVTAPVVIATTPLKSRDNVAPPPPYVVWQCENALRFLKKVQHELKDYLGDSANGSHKSYTVEPISLKGGFIKIEALKRNYRPYYHLFKKPTSEWPKIELTREDGAFRLSPKKDIPKEDKQKGGETNQLKEINMTRKSRSRSTQNIKKPQENELLKSPANSQKNSVCKNQAQQKDSSDKQCGVCEICKIEYDALTIHLKTKDHEYFAKNSQNFIALDSLITSSADVSKFLDENRKLEAKTELEEMEVDQEELVDNEVDPLEDDDDVDDDDEEDDADDADDAAEEESQKSCTLNKPRALEQKAVSPTLREKSKRSTKGKHSSEKFKNAIVTTTTCAAITTTKSPKTPSPQKPATLPPLVVKTPVTSRKKHSGSASKAALSPPIRAMLPPNSLYKVVETLTEVQCTPTKNRVGTANDSAVVASPSIIVKFKKVRNTELQVLNGEAENFMFPKKRSDSSELPTDIDRHTSSDRVHNTASICTSSPASSPSVTPSASEDENEDDFEECSKKSLVNGNKAIAKAKRKMPSQPKRIVTTPVNTMEVGRHAYPKTPIPKVSTTLKGEGGRQSFPKAPIQPFEQLKKNTNSRRNSVVAPSSAEILAETAKIIFPEATRKSSRTATAIVTAATTSTRLMQAAVDAAKNKNKQQLSASTTTTTTAAVSVAKSKSQTSKRTQKQDLKSEPADKHQSPQETKQQQSETVEQGSRKLRFSHRQSVVFHLEDRMGEIPEAKPTQKFNNNHSKINSSNKIQSNSIIYKNEIDVEEDEYDDVSVDNDDEKDEDYYVGESKAKTASRKSSTTQVQVQPESISPSLNDSSTREERLARRQSRVIAQIKLELQTDFEQEKEHEQEEIIVEAPKPEKPTAQPKSPPKKSPSKSSPSKSSPLKSSPTKQEQSSPSRFYDYTKSERLKQLRYAFERLPDYDLWYRVYKRQDNCQEKYFEYFGSTKYRKLPYEMGAIPFDMTLQGALGSKICCKLCQNKNINKQETEVKQKAARRDLLLDLKTKNVNEKRTSNIQREETNCSSTSAAPTQQEHSKLSNSTTDSTMQYTHKHKKLHLLQRYRQEQEQQEMLQRQKLEEQVQSSNAHRLCNQAEIKTEDVTRDSVRNREERAGSTHSNVSSCASSTATVSKSKRMHKKLLNKAAFMAHLELPPRKSPREHASTLALVSCIIKQRKDSLSKSNSEIDEPITPTESKPIILPVEEADKEEEEEEEEATATRLKTPPPTLIQPQKSARESPLPQGVVLNSPRTRSQAPTPIEELRFATEISENVKRMRRGRNKYDYSPPFVARVGSARSSKSRAAANNVALNLFGRYSTGNSSYALSRQRSRTPNTNKVVLATNGSKLAKATQRGGSYRNSSTKNVKNILPAIRKTGSKRGVLEYEGDSSALEALKKITTEYKSPKLLEWQIDKFLTLMGPEYDNDLEYYANPETVAVTTSTAVEQDDEEVVNEVLSRTVPPVSALNHIMLNTPPATDCFSSDFDLYDLVHQDLQAGNKDAHVHKTANDRHSKKFSIFNTSHMLGYYRKRKNQKTNRTGWPKVSRKKAVTRQESKKNKIYFLQNGLRKEENLESKIIIKEEKNDAFPIDGVQDGDTTQDKTRESGVMTPPDSEAEMADDGNIVVQEKQDEEESILMEDDESRIGLNEDSQTANEDEEEDEEEDEDNEEDNETMADSIEEEGNQAKADSDGEIDADMEEVDEDDEEDKEREDDDEPEDIQEVECKKILKKSKRSTTKPFLSNEDEDSYEPQEKRLRCVDEACTASPLDKSRLNNVNLNIATTSTPCTPFMRALRRTPQLNGSLGSCISPSEKAGDNSDIFTVSSDGLDTDLDLSNSHSQLRNTGDDDHHHHQHLHHHDHSANTTINNSTTTPKRKFDLSKYAPTNAASCAAEAATAAVKSLAISQFLKKEVRVTCRRLRAPFRRFRYRR